MRHCLRFGIITGWAGWVGCAIWLNGCASSSTGASGFAPGSLEFPPSYRRPPQSDARLRGDVLAELAVDPGVDVFSLRTRVSDGGRVSIEGTAGSESERNRATVVASRVPGVREVINHSRTDAEVTIAEAAPKSDATLKRVIAEILASDSRIESASSAVSVSGGVVTLYGEVRRLSSKLWASEDAREVPGVKQVVNRMVVNPVRRRADAKLAREARAALGLDPILGAQAIRVGVEAGVVQLEGEVPTERERELAQDMISQVLGVLELQNRLQLARPESFPAQESAPEEAPAPEETG